MVGWSQGEHVKLKLSSTSHLTNPGYARHVSWNSGFASHVLEHKTTWVANGFKRKWFKQPNMCFLFSEQREQKPSKRVWYISCGCLASIMFAACPVPMLKCKNKGKTEAWYICMSVCLFSTEADMWQLLMVEGISITFSVDFSVKHNVITNRSSKHNNVTVSASVCLVRWCNNYYANAFVCGWYIHNFATSNLMTRVIIVLSPGSLIELLCLSACQLGNFFIMESD